MTSSRVKDATLYARHSSPLRLAALLSCLAAVAIGPAAIGQQNRRAAPLTPPRAGAVRKGASSISVVFTKADVRDVLTQIAGYTNADILVTPGASGTISINLRNRTAEQAIRLVAAVAGLTVVKIGGAFMVGPAAEVQAAAAEFGTSQVVPLKYLKPDAAVTALSSMLPRIRVEAASNGVVISGLDADIAEAQAALRQMDVEPAPTAPVKPETSIVSLKSADPEEAARLLSEAFPGIKITRKDRNLIVTGVPTDLAAVDKAVQALDVEAPPAPEPREVFVYRLKFLNSKSAATALRSALGGGSGQQPGDSGGDQAAPSGPITAGKVTITEAPEAIAPPAANFNPLSSTGGFGGSSGSSGGSSGGSGGGTSGGSGGSAGGGAGGTGGGGAPQPLSRPTRLIIIGPRDQIEIARSILEQTDLPQPLVRIEAVVVEVNSDYIKNLGLTWDVSGTNFTFNQPAGAGGLITGQGHATVSLNALVTQNRARVLASPNISVVDNEDASIFIGELRRFLGGTVVTANVGTVQAVESLPVGIALLIRPRIHPNGDVTLKVHPVISAVTSTIQGLPQTSSREADTTIRLKEGEEMVIGGLDQVEVTRNIIKLPILGDIPVIGEFFRSRSTEKKKTTVVVIIRATPVLTELAPTRDFKKGITK